MDSGIRDLEQIRERDPSEGSFRRTAIVALASAATASLVIALALLVSDAATPEETEPADDPLALLDQAAALSQATRPTEDEAAAEAAHEPTVEPESLSFPEALARDERPEVHTALAAAAAEYEHPDPLPAGHEPSLAGLSDRATLSHVLPAAVAAGPDSEHLARAAVADPLIAAALPIAAPHSAPVPAGRDGRFTLQIISYRTRAEADLFTDALRSKGHSAFVTVGDILDRGTFYRVRVGPFETLADARAYRTQFEASEGMNTFIVRQRDPLPSD